jgi:uncharacterized protein (DUF488 family)
MEHALYTIGHSNHELPRFIELLRQHGVTAVADVRSSPYSAYNPQFNRETLQAHLTAAGIAYIFLGNELGARRSEPECYDDEGRVCYGRVAQTAVFRAGLERLSALRHEQRVALMCAEKDPLTCHRTILICRALRESSSPRARGTGSPDIRHIREDGSIETQDAAESRLLALCKLPERDLFHTRDDLVAEAYEKQGANIAYVATEREVVSAW